MLVEINLLPKKEAKPIALLLVFSVFFVLVLLATLFFYIKGNSYLYELQSLQQRIDLAEKSSALEQKQATIIESSNSVEQLKKSILWAQSYPIKTIPLMQKLTALLPERGFIQNFGYDETGTIKISVQFDTESEAAFFLSRLNGTDWIDQVKMTKLTAQAISGPSVPNAATTTSTDLPRYLGEYELTLNQTAFKTGQAGAGNDNGGVVGK